MDSEEDKSGKALAELGVSRPEEVSSLFAEVRQRFDAESSAARDESTWKEFRDAWLGRKSGVLTRVTDNWLKPATPELKRVVGQELNTLRAHVETKIEERHAAIEAGAEKASLAKAAGELALPVR